jgi:multiple sugar transport system ATP-binding protein
MAEIVLDEITKRFPDGTEAVKAMSLDIEDGEFMILVGPSGCGKSTALRMIAGLEEVSEGEIRIGGQVVNALSPRERDIAMVFQNYALYPHMSVRKNMGFALELQKVAKSEIEQRVREAAEILDLMELLDRKPAQLSGGQRQRVAMGRAIVRDPSAFLMDEPLSNLDAKLRVQMRAEVARIQQRLGTTTVYVTHDQTEAMTLGDRVAVMRRGVVQQVGAPGELYDDPANLFVAGFLGSPAMNFMPAEIDGDRIKLPMLEAKLPDEKGSELGREGKRSLIAGVRPEDFEDPDLVGDQKERGATFRTKLEVVESMGSELLAHFSVDWEGLDSGQLRDAAKEAGTVRLLGSSGQGEAVARLDPASKAKPGEDAELWLDLTKLHFFDENGATLARER